ncbi:MAG TPA: MerR family DNA-binding transcriptional regulator, partial [Terrabacter sp.]|nr:MerR family DNA-binding transcriptional regulator [Terrabacter sp.]
MSALTIGQVAERTGAAPSALRYWEELGLIRAIRTAGNQR